MENKALSLTDDIYAELGDGLKTGLDWTHFLAKHSASKGPLYNAIGRFFNDMEPKIGALSEVQVQLDAAGLTLEQLDQRIKESESNLALLDERKTVLNEQNKMLETKLAYKSDLLKHAGELSELGFDIERLRQLKDTLTEIGARNGLKSKEAISKFFAALKDYDAKTGFEEELQRLVTVTETRKLEAENWQAKEEALRRKHNDLKETIDAVSVLVKKGVKADQLIIWHRILKQFETVEQFDESLAQYAGVSELLNARKQETMNYEVRLTKAQSQVRTLEKERVKIEGAIDVLKVAGVKGVEAMAETMKKQLQTVAASEIRETQIVGREVRSEFSGYFTQVDQLLENVFQIGQRYERLKEQLQEYEGIKDVLESHAVASGAAK